eukprot:2953395-Pleurochrysis_carterae.AAC.1
MFERKKSPAMRGEVISRAVDGAGCALEMLEIQMDIKGCSNQAISIKYIIGLRHTSPACCILYRYASP